MTAVSSRLKVTVSEALATLLMAVPPAKVTRLLSVTDSVVPLSPVSRHAENGKLMRLLPAAVSLPCASTVKVATAVELP